MDIDERLLAARQAVEPDQKLALFLARQVPPQPFIARRHYFQRGTLRYFEVRYSDLNALATDLFSDVGDADGRVVLCLPRDSADRAAMQKAAQTVLDRPVVAVVPQDLLDLQELSHELACLQWVSQHTPELETDRTVPRKSMPALPWRSRTCAYTLSGCSPQGMQTVATGFGKERRYHWHRRGSSTTYFPGFVMRSITPRRPGEMNLLTAAPYHLPLRPLDEISLRQCLNVLPRRRWVSWGRRLSAACTKLYFVPLVFTENKAVNSAFTAQTSEPKRL